MGNQHRNCTSTGKKNTVTMPRVRKSMPVSEPTQSSTKLYADHLRQLYSAQRKTKDRQT
jgi:hypothetical protein